MPAPINNTDFSKETENPVTRQITLPLRYQADFLDGADRLTKSTFELDQAVVLFRLNEDWSLITRTKLFGRSAATEEHRRLLEYMKTQGGFRTRRQ